MEILHRRQKLFLSNFEKFASLQCKIMENTVCALLQIWALDIFSAFLWAERCEFINNIWFSGFIKLFAGVIWAGCHLQRYRRRECSVCEPFRTIYSAKWYSIFRRFHSNVFIVPINVCSVSLFQLCLVTVYVERVVTSADRHRTSLSVERHGHYSSQI